MNGINGTNGMAGIGSIRGFEGTVSEDVVFLLMVESQLDLNQQMQDQISSFKADMALQKKYGFFRSIMSQLPDIEANKSGTRSGADNDNGIIKPEQVNAIVGLTDQQKSDLMARAELHENSDGTEYRYLDAGIVAGYLNETLFAGDTNKHVNITAGTKIPVGDDAMNRSDDIYTEIDRAMNANTTDPALRSVEMQQIQHKVQQMMSMWSSFFKNDHETKMSIINKM